MDEFITIPTPDHVTLDFELAHLGSRFAALFIDSVIVLVLLLAGGIALALLLGGLDWAMGENLGVALWIMAAFLLIWGYRVFCEWVLTGKTLGKLLLGIRVIRADGLPIGLREAAIRNLLIAGDLAPVPLPLGMFVASANARGQRLGDMAAGTVVVRERFLLTADLATGAAWAARVERGQSRHAITLPRGAITANQLALIEQFLARRHQLPADRRAAIAWQIAEPLLDVIGQDRRAVAFHPLRGAWCEQILLAVLDLARHPDATTGSPVPAVQASQPSLF